MPVFFLYVLNKRLFSCDKIKRNDYINGGESVRGGVVF